MSALTLPTAFNLQPHNELIAFVGGGGKTSLLFALGAALPGRRVLTTTTRIFAAQMSRAEAVIFFTAENAENAEKKLGQALDKFGVCLVVGAVAGDKAVGVPPELPGAWLARPDVDFVLVEADGSRMRPIKAPAAHEPMIPPETTLVVPVVGIDALDGRFPNVTHRPEIAAQLLDSVVGERLSVTDVAQLIAHPQGGLKGVPTGARVIPFINKVATAVQLNAARQIAQQLIRQSPRIERVIIGAAKTDQPVREVQQRVAAVVLAAGEGKRMGQTKQLLPWGDTTVLGQTLRNVQQTAVHHQLVVTGHEAAAVQQIAHRAGVETLHNPAHAAGEMLSSLQTAVRALDESVTAVLVLLADQPMVKPQTMDLLLKAYWQGHGDLIAPVFAGRRGNPVLIGRRFFAELLALPPGDAPRTLLRHHFDQLHLVEVPTDDILRDLDSLEQYEHERRQWESAQEI